MKALTSFMCCQVLADLESKQVAQAKARGPHADLKGIDGIIAEKFAEKTVEAVTKKPAEKGEKTAKV